MNPNSTVLISSIILSILLISTHAKGQLTPDAKSAIIEIQGENHSTLKIGSDGTSEDTSEIKLINYASGSGGTEFVIRSINETGLSIGSHSNLTANNSPQSIFISPNGEINMSSLQSSDYAVLGVDAEGTLITIPRSKFSYRTNLNTPNVAIDNTAWTACGPSFTVTKDDDRTILDCEFRGAVQFYGSPAAGANWLRVRIQIAGQSTSLHFYGEMNKDNLWETLNARSVFQSLPAGSYTVQLHARTNNHPANIFLGLNGFISVEERY